MISNEEVLKFIPKLTWDGLNDVHKGRLSRRFDIVDLDEREVDGIHHWETRTYGFGKCPAFIVTIKYKPDGSSAGVQARGEYGMSGALGIFSNSVVYNMDELKTVLITAERSCFGGPKRLQDD